MKMLIPLLIVSTSALAATTIQYAQRANTATKRAEDALIASQKQQVTIRELQESHRTLERQLTEAREEAQRVAKVTPAPAPAVNHSTSTARPAASAPPRAATFGVFSNAAPARGFAMRAMPYAGASPWANASPAAQRYMRQQQRTMLRKQYDDLGEALGLSEEQSNRMIDVLADQQTRQMTQARPGLTDMTSMMKAAQETQERNKAELANVIGQDKVRLWEEYQAELPQRFQVKMVGDQLEMMGTPLTSDQRKQLVTVLVEDGERQWMPAPQEGLSQEEQWQQSMKWQDENDKRLLERLKPVLTSEQYGYYRDFQEYQTEMRHTMFRNFPPLPPPENGETNGQAENGISVLRSFSLPAQKAQ